ncbi:MAG: thiamine biosynthesis protein ApbE [Rhodospirillaceae bacterium]|nr:thiamine biosynthesis protein ApbE [Rhodospirillaceae bacterium]
MATDFPLIFHSKYWFLYMLQKYLCKRYISSLKSVNFNFFSLHAKLSSALPPVLLLFLTLNLHGCGSESDQKQLVTLRGTTMGTTYNVSIKHHDAERLGQMIHKEVETILDNVNLEMSNWDKSSSISKFNYLRKTDPISITVTLAKILSGANKIHDQSEGAFDITLMPLTDIWGFGRKNVKRVPSEQEIETALKSVGQKRLLVLDQKRLTLRKKIDEASVDLSGIAKGFAIDQISTSLKARGISDFLVEIGGDLYASGEKGPESPWIIGIEKPDQRFGEVDVILRISNKAVATSGDYRNFFEKDNRRYSHIIDPKTGRPISHQTASVTVLAENAMNADAWATAMMVLGAKKGLVIAEKNNLAVFFILRKGANFHSVSSRHFKDAVLNSKTNE